MKIKVAVFEDNKILRESLQQLINNGREMACTGVFPDANKFIGDIELANPDVVLMDMEMPGISSVEAVQAIRYKFPDIKILMQTVFDEDEKIYAAICAGATGYVVKSNASQKLIESIRDVNAGGTIISPFIAGKILREFQADLTAREKQILGMLVKSKTNKMIAEECLIPSDSVINFIRLIYKKLQAQSGIM